MSRLRPTFAALLAVALVQGAPRAAAQDPDWMKQLFPPSTAPSTPRSEGPAADQEGDGGDAAAMGLFNLFLDLSRIASQKIDKPLALSAEGYPYVLVSDQWVKMGDVAFQDLAVGADGGVWATGMDECIYAWDEGKWKNSGDGRAVRVAVDRDRNPWVVNRTDFIYRMVNNRWQSVAGRAKDIGVGGNGVAWAIGQNEDIYRREGDHWTRVPGMATRVAVGPKGEVWVADKQNAIFRWNDTEWVRVPGLAKDISIDSKGVVWKIDPEGGVSFRDTSGQWISKPGIKAKAVVGP